MRFHENEKCPVCDKIFTENDDIVTCPECGTPHHRECYNSLGHCFNANMHGEDFEYSFSAPESVVKENQQEADSESTCYKPRQDAGSKTVCSECGKEIPFDAPFCAYCGARQENPIYTTPTPINIPQGEEQAYINSTQTIDGKSISDVASVVRTNTARFIPRFMKNKSFSWNWCGFIFGPFYLLFRKMYKEGIMAIVIRLIISLFAQGAYTEQYIALSKFFNKNYQALMQNPSGELFDEYIKLFENILPMFLIIIAANIIINVVIALFADRIYRARVLKVLDKVDEALEEGGSFNQTSPFMMEQQPLSQEEMKRLYLGRLGGTSIFAPIIAWLALNIISNYISRL